MEKKSESKKEMIWKMVGEGDMGAQMGEYSIY